MGYHTILLIQKSRLKGTRTFTDHGSVAAALESVLDMYENKLKESNPEVKHITYDIRDLNEFLDSLVELCALVFSPQTQSYVPQDKDWIKNKIFQHLQNAAHHFGGK